MKFLIFIDSFLELHVEDEMYPKMHFVLVDLTNK